jgi:hypothetical protein
MGIARNLCKNIFQQPQQGKRTLASVKLRICNLDHYQLRSLGRLYSRKISNMERFKA